MLSSASARPLTLPSMRAHAERWNDNDDTRIQGRIMKQNHVVSLWNPGDQASDGNVLYVNTAGNGACDKLFGFFFSLKASNGNKCDLRRYDAMRHDCSDGK